MRISPISKFNSVNTNFKSKKDEQYYKPYYYENLEGGGVLKVPETRVLVLTHGGMGGRQMGISEIEKMLRDNGTIKPSASKEEVDKAIRERINAFKPKR